MSNDTATRISTSPADSLPFILGQVLRTAAELDALPHNAILQSTDGDPRVAFKRGETGDRRKSWALTNVAQQMRSAQMLVISATWQIVAVGDCTDCDAPAPVTADDHEAFCPQTLGA